MAAQLANHCLLEKYETGIVHLILDEEGEELRSSGTEADLRSALNTYYKEPVKLNITATKISTETPDKRRVRVEKECQQAAEQKIADDPFVQELQKELDATIVSGSIKIKKK